MEIREDSVVRCPWCGKEHMAIEWESNSFGQCKSRETKREYRSIYSDKEWKKSSKSYYLCPSCNLWSNGNQLILLDKNGDIIKGIGGRPIIKEVKQ